MSWNDFMISSWLMFRDVEFGLKFSVLMQSGVVMSCSRVGKFSTIFSMFFFVNFCLVIGWRKGISTVLGVEVTFLAYVCSRCMGYLVLYFLLLGYYMIFLLDILLFGGSFLCSNYSVLWESLRQYLQPSIFTAMNLPLKFIESGVVFLLKFSRNKWR